VSEEPYLSIEQPPINRSVKAKLCPHLLATSFQDAHSFGNYFGADAVAGEEGDIEVQFILQNYSRFADCADRSKCTCAKFD
jgi:hypothetical protein